MNRRSLEALEYPQVLERVAARALSEAGRRAVLGRQPSTDRDAVGTELLRVREARDLLVGEPDWHPPEPPPASLVLDRLEAEGSVLSGEELHQMGLLLAAVEDLRQGLQPRVDAYSALGALRHRLHPLPDARKELEATVDADGHLDDSASPDLRRIRRSLSSARSRLVRRLEEFMGSLPDRYRVPDASISVREGSYVVPIRREGKNEVGGIIHGESATGATLFVEPTLAIRHRNEIRELEREEAQEVQRILRAWTDELRPRAQALRESYEALVDFDTLWARARAARDWEADVPELLEPTEESMAVVRGRHPLLLEQGVEVVPFDLALDPGERGLVISGPNTGGKTVFLKSLGLLAALAQSGILPPVSSGTRLPVFRDLFVDIGDQQSIAESLSTFSARLARTREILQGADHRDLVLVDEIGTGTDPDEGAALARAIVQSLVERRSLTVVTSHLGALKHLDREGSGIVNASLQFDPDRIAPTYEFRKGRPGRSYGLAIARSLGIPGPVLDRAEGHLSEGRIRVEDLLERLEREEKRARELSSELERERREVERLRAEVEERESELRQRERSWERDARRDARELLMEARREVEEAIREVRESAERGDDEAARQEVERQARRRVEEAAKRQERKMPGGGGESGAAVPVEAGDPVRLVDSGTKGTVAEVREDRVVVEVSGLRFEVPASGLEPVEGGANEGAARAGRARSGTSGTGDGGGGWRGPAVQASPEVDLRGLRVDEVDAALARAVDDAILAGLTEVRIIHGKGTGALRRRVAELLEDEERVESFRGGGHGEGGAGVTLARLR